jgi:hypothetical protein
VATLPPSLATETRAAGSSPVSPAADVPVGAAAGEDVDGARRVLSFCFHSSTLLDAVAADVVVVVMVGDETEVDEEEDAEEEAGLMRHSGSSQRHSVVRLTCESESDRVGERVYVTLGRGRRNEVGGETARSAASDLCHHKKKVSKRDRGERKTTITSSDARLAKAPESNPNPPTTSGSQTQ